MITDTYQSDGAYSKFAFIDTFEFSDLLAAFVELESGHGLHTTLLGGLLIRIDIYLGEDN